MIELKTTINDNEFTINIEENDDFRHLYTKIDGRLLFVIKCHNSYHITLAIKTVLDKIYVSYGIDYSYENDDFIRDIMTLYNDYISIKRNQKINQILNEKG